MNNASLINQTSGKVDFWTPQPIIEAARECMGGIDLDPASTAEANKRVRAFLFFNEFDNGLEREWCGRVFCNPPFRRETNAAWVKKLIDSFEGGVEAACYVTFASTSEKWFRPLLKRPQCFLVPRTNYLTPDGRVLRGVTKGSVVTYLGQHVDRFHAAFKQFGEIKVSL